jgi:hypothetical protein
LILLGAALGICAFTVIALAGLYQLAEDCMTKLFVTERCFDDERGFDQPIILQPIAQRGESPFVSDIRMSEITRSPLLAERRSIYP